MFNCNILYLSEFQYTKFQGKNENDNLRRRYDDLFSQDRIIPHTVAYMTDGQIGKETEIRCIEHIALCMVTCGKTNTSTPWAIKTCHCIFGPRHNFHVSWWIFTLLVPMERGMNVLYRVVTMLTTLP